MLSGFRFTVVTLLLLSVTACVYVPLRGRQQYRREQYFASSPRAVSDDCERHRNRPRRAWDGSGTGLGCRGRSRQEVAVPRSNVEVWLYPSVRFHQDPAHSHGASSFRLVFIDGILRVIEPI